MKKSIIFFIMILYIGCGSVEPPDKKPQNAKEAFEYGRYWYLNKHFENAIAKFSDAIAIDPNYVDAYIGRANAQREMGNLLLLRDNRISADAYHNSALADFAKAGQLNPNNVDVHYGLGLLYFDRVHVIEKIFTKEEIQSYRDLAIKNFKRFLELSKSMESYYVVNRYLGILLAKQESPDSKKEAKKYLTIYVEFLEKNLANWKNYVPKNDLEQENKERAIRSLEDQLKEFKSLLSDIEKIQ